MRLKITAVTDKPCIIPYDYQYKLHSALYALFKKSDEEFSSFLHDTGYKFDEQYRYKLFTFSRLNFTPYHTNEQGFFLVKRIDFIFSTAIDKNFEHLMHGLFPDAELILKFKDTIKFTVRNVELLSEPEFSDEKQKFICLSPIVVTTQKKEGEKIRKYYLNYFRNDERELWNKNLKTNLQRKYKAINNREWTESDDFVFEFDADYITTAKSSIKKICKINNISVIGFLAPFSLKCSRELKKIAYDTGLGEQNATGFGCVDLYSPK